MTPEERCRHCDTPLPENDCTCDGARADELAEQLGRFRELAEYEENGWVIFAMPPEIAEEIVDAPATPTAARVLAGRVAAREVMLQRAHQEMGRLEKQLDDAAAQKHELEEDRDRLERRVEGLKQFAKEAAAWMPAEAQSPSDAWAIYAQAKRDARGDAALMRLRQSALNFIDLIEKAAVERPLEDRSRLAVQLETIRLHCVGAREGVNTGAWETIELLPEMAGRPPDARE